MNLIRIIKPSISLTLAISILFISCRSATLIQSTPSAAELFLNEERVGVTPYTHSDTKIVGSVTTVRLEKEGYEILNTQFSRNEEADVGAIIGGIFFLFPFLWTMKYKPTHSYELMPISNSGTETVTPNSKAAKIRELSKLLEEGLITQEEFDKEKLKILESN